MYIDRCGVRSRRVDVIIDGDGLRDSNGVTTIIGDRVGSGDYFRTSVAIRHIRHVSDDRIDATVICFISDNSYIWCGYITNTLYGDRCGVRNRRVDVIIDSDGLSDSDGVTTIIGDRVGTRDYFRTGVAIRHIIDESDDRIDGAVICFVSDDGYIWCGYITNTLYGDRCWVRSRRVDVIIDGDGLRDSDGVTTIIGDGICA